MPASRSPTAIPAPTCSSRSTSAAARRGMHRGSAPYVHPQAESHIPPMPTRRRPSTFPSPPEVHEFADATVLDIFQDERHSYEKCQYVEFKKRVAKMNELRESKDGARSN
jgi:hypothetical protein